MTVKALTLHRPWAELILLDAPIRKRVENRGWWTSYRGDLVLHSGLEYDPAALQLARSIPGALEAAEAAGVDLTESAPAGLRGVAKLVSICSPALRYPCTCDSPWAVDGLHHWRLREPRRLFEPIPCRGHQGLWPLGADLIAEVAIRLDAS